MLTAFLSNSQKIPKQHLIIDFWPLHFTSLLHHYPQKSYDSTPSINKCSVKMSLKGQRMSHSTEKVVLNNINKYNRWCFRQGRMHWREFCYVFHGTFNLNIAKSKWVSHRCCGWRMACGGCSGQETDPDEWTVTKPGGGKRNDPGCRAWVRQDVVTTSHFASEPIPYIVSPGIR